MLARHDSGKHAFAILCLIVVASALAAPSLVLAGQTPPAYVGVDHVDLTVSSRERSLRFYRRLFGSDLMKDRQNDRRYLRLGSGYLAIDQQDPAGIGQVCFGIRGFDVNQMHVWLKGKNLAWHDNPGAHDLWVADRDGSRVQLAEQSDWAHLQQTTAAPESLPTTVDALFHPLALDEVYITVTNLEVDSLYYARLLGRTGTMQAGSLWFEVGSARLRLSQAPVGQAAGVNYFSVLVSNTDLEAAAEAVFKAGGIIENILPNGFSFWDPDGMRVEIHVAALL